MTRRSFWGMAAAALIAACSGEDGPPGPSAPVPGYVAPEANGVVGVVTDPSGAAVTHGTVYFVPADAVKALPATTIDNSGAASADADPANDEPLEDLIKTVGDTFAKADVGADGVYRLASLPAGKFFVTYVPAAATHLPGGSACRDAKATAGLVGQRLDIKVSGNVPAGAEYVGSGKCINCHGRSHIDGTMHRLGIWSPYEAGPLQNLSARADDLYQAFDKFDAANGVQVAFYNCTDRATAMDWCITKELAAGEALPANTFFTAQLAQIGGKYQLTLTNVLNPADPLSGVPFTIDAVYGGGVLKQRYMTKVTPAGKPFYYAILPIQFQNDGSDDYLAKGAWNGTANGSGRANMIWRDYNAKKWFSLATDTAPFKLKVPGTGDSFEKNCISCHAVGVQVSGNDADGWRAKTVRDAVYGDFDYDGDGVREEMNIGCETCHGPGSKHLEASSGRGKSIVALSLLTPERETMVCGQCHSRPKGKMPGATGSDSPMNAEGLMMLPGTSRPDFLANHTSRFDAANSDYWNDGIHSKSHHQQYTDLIKSSKYKNDSYLVTCSDCHDLHRKTSSPRQLRAAAQDLCVGCHTAATGPGTAVGTLTEHSTAQIGYPHASVATLSCADCHMPKTAKTGSGEPGLLRDAKQYWQNDISSHLFDMPRKAAAATTGMPVAYSNACGSCHNSGL
jgi:predicted CXXCH cytochrome family protein